MYTIQNDKLNDANKILKNFEVIYISKHTQPYFVKTLQCLSRDKTDNNIWPPHTSDWIKLSDIRLCAWE